MRAAVALASRLGGELMGMFLEDTNLLRLAGLPFAREIFHWSAQERPLTERDLTLSLRTVAARTQSELERVAGRARIRWSFRVQRGPRLQLLMEAGEATDVLLVGEARRSSRAGTLEVRGIRREPAVYLVYTGSTASRRALKMAAAMLEDEGGGLGVLVVADKHKELKRLHAEAVRRLERRGLVARILDCLEDQGAESVLEHLARLSGVALILPADLRVPSDPSLFQRLLDRVGCPVVLVR
jgi:hypothetical protein